MLRQAAQSPDGYSVDKIWCVIAGNDKLVNDITYYAIASKKSVKIVSREHIKIDENKMNEFCKKIIGRHDFVGFSSSKILYSYYSKIAFILLTPDEQASSFFILKCPIFPVLST